MCANSITFASDLFNLHTKFYSIMRKTLQLFVMLSLLLVGAGSSYAAEESLTATSTGFTSAVSTIKFEKGKSPTTPAWYSPTYRMYAKNTLTITPNSGVTITEIVYTFKYNKKKSKVPTPTLNSSEGTLATTSTGATWTGSTTNAVVLYADGTAGNFGFTGLKITYTEGQKTVTATISDAGYSTYVTEQPTDFSTAVGLTAFKATFNEAQTVVTITPIATAPANTPVILKGAKGDYELAVAEAVPAALTDNELKVSDGTVTGDGSTVWVLASGDNGIGFYPMGSGVTVPKGKAYLQITASTGAKPFLGMSGGSTTGIKVIGADGKRGDGVMYNLAGQRVGKSYKGIVIMNGKKYINR